MPSAEHGGEYSETEEGGPIKAEVANAIKLEVEQSINICTACFSQDLPSRLRILLCIKFAKSTMNQAHSNPDPPRIPCYTDYGSMARSRGFGIGDLNLS